MFYKLKRECYIRCFEKFGYIKSYNAFYDKVFDDIGSIFLSAITRNPKTEIEIANDIVKKFNDVELNDIIDDVVEFLESLVYEGFLSVGATPEEAKIRDVWECYKPENLERHVSVSGPETTHTQDFLDEYVNGDPMIFSFEIELTSKCNERCIHCYIPHELKLNLLDKDLYYSVLKELKDMGTLGVTLTGGEPMLHPNFKEFLREAKRMDFAVTVLSNLTLLDDETLQIMKEGSLTSVQVSLYSMDPSHHDAITQLPGSHKKTVEAILKLVENNIPVQISCPTMTINKGDFADVYKWAFERNIKAYTDYSIMAKFNHDTDNLENRLSPKECEKIIRDIINTDRNYQEEILADDFEQKLLTIVDNPEDKFCGVGFSSCCMVSNGDIYPCAGWQSAICGNVKHDTLHNIWKNSAQLKFLRNLRKKDIKKCLDCQNKAFCSPCLTRFANESGDPLIVPDYFCEVAKVNKEVVLEWRKENK